MTISRRTFVKGAVATPALATVASAGCGNPVSAAPIVEVELDVDPTSEHYGQIVLPVPQYPDLAKVGGAVTLVLKTPPAGKYPFSVPSAVLLINRGPAGDPNAFIAARSECPHQGCPLGYSASQRQIECPCHGSRFLAFADAGDPKSCVGLVTHLPAQDNLTIWRTRVSGDYVFVDLSTDLSCDTSASFPPVINGEIIVPLAAYPALVTVGGSLVGKPQGLDDKLILARVANDQLIVLSAVCTHRGCTIKLELDAARMHCPCHGSAFAFDGSVLNGPATTPVKAYPVDFSDQSTAVISTK